MNRVITGGLLALFLLAAAAIPALAAPTIDAGSHTLLPDTPLQQIELYVTGGDLVQGFNLYVQVADGGPEASVDFPSIPGVDGPAITGLDLVSGTIFESDNAGQLINDIGYPQYLDGNITTSSPAGQGGDPGTSVAATGLVATVTIDTTGFMAGGSYPLVLEGVLGGIVSTDFPLLPTNVTNGTITIGSFASSNSLTSTASGSWGTTDTWSAGDATPSAVTAVTVDDDEVSVDRNHDAFSLQVNSPAGKVVVGVNDRLVVHENVNVAAGTLATEISGTNTGVLHVGGQLNVGSFLDKLGLDWVPDGPGSEFGGTYEIAQYGTLNGTGFNSVDGGNIGSKYVQSVDYGSGTEDAVTVTLHDLSPCDANLDGDVDVFAIDGSGDAQVLTAHLGTATGMTWTDGDFNFDGDVDVFAIDGSGDAQRLTANLGSSVADIGHDVAAGTAEAIYNVATGELFFDVGDGIAVVGIGADVVHPEKVDTDSIFGTPAQSDSKILAYFDPAGLPVGEGSVGLVLPPGLEQDDIVFSYSPPGSSTVFAPVTMIVPEPSTLAMLVIVGLIGVFWKRRKG